MYKIAFHLARGVHYMNWQIKGDNGEVIYVNPNESDIVLHNCKLKNQKSTSMKIFKGSDKFRCAWVQFDSFEIVPLSDYTSKTQVRFNPRVKPTWVVAGVDEQDNREFGVLYTNRSQLFA
jgi:hypothetical protein